MECVTNIFSSIVVETAKSLASPITRRLGYLIYYTRNINNLKATAQKLDDKKNTVKLQIDAAGRDGKDVIAPSVDTWQKEVEAIKLKIEEFLENEIKRCNKCFNGLIPNPILLYSLSRNAAKMTSEVDYMLQEVGKFNEIAFSAAPPTVGSIINLEGIKDFKSRELIMNEVWAALKDDKVSMIGICGMGGVGKTTMMKKLVKRVEKEKLFDEVAMAAVSHNLDFKNIQSEIAARLGLKFNVNEDTLSVRAGRLHEKVMNHLNGGKKVLLILDDVWDKVDFGIIGLPSGSQGKRFKIVLTSRFEEVCNLMGSQRNFPIKVLSKDEAWEPFRELAGSVVENSDVNLIAREVAKECGGLPIAIATVARALETESKDIWEGALQELRKSIPENISGMQDEVFSRIELSYNWLRSEEAQSCFLLCCLFPEDFNIPIEYLVTYGIGLRLFKGINNLHQARNKVSMLINKLNRSFLLLEGSDCETVKMHDLVRDVAITITSKREHLYLVKCDAEMKEWPERVRHEYFNAISLSCKNIKEHPSDLQCPKLELLQLLGQCENFPNNFFQGMKELKVLSLNIPLLPESFNVLKNLRTLYLKNLMCEDISILGALINLEILKIETSSLEMLPEEIGQLVNLRLLDLREMPTLRYIPSGVLSKLSKLEEFYVIETFQEWKSMVNGEKTNASLKEIETHPVTALQIWVPTTLFLPKVSFLKNLKRFKISIGEYFFYEFHKDSENELFLQNFLCDDNLCSEINVLLRKTETLILLSLEILKSVLCQLEYDGFPHLKRLWIFQCGELEYVVDAMQRIPQVGFPKLEELSLDMCNSLKNVFPLSMARGLTQLQSIEIKDCRKIEGILYGKKVDDEIEFPKLISLRLFHLPKLIGFCIDTDDPAMEPSLTSTQDVEQHSASQMNKTTNIEYDQLRHSRIRIRLQNLQKLELKGCDSLLAAFPFTVVGQLVQLQTIKIDDCQMMEYIFQQGQEENNLVFPNLITMTLYNLPNLMAFYPNSHISFDWPSLRELIFVICAKMKTSYHIPSLSTLIQNIDIPAHNLPHGKEVMCPTPCSIIRGLKIRKGRQQQSVDPNLTLQQPEQKVSMMKSKDALYVCNNIDGLTDTDQMHFAFPSKLLARMSNLKKLKIEGSDTLEVIFAFEESHDPIQALNSLEDLSLWRLPKLQHIWLNIPPKIKVLQNLRSLYLRYCDNLICLFSQSEAKLLVNLQELRIGYCEMMEEIMGKEEEEANMPDKIVFPHLRMLSFYELPKLRSFYSGNYALEFPSLDEMSFNECFNMRAFSYGPISTAKLVKVIINEESFGIEDLQKMLSTRVYIYSEETLTRIGYDKFPEGDFSKLLAMHVGRCNNLVSIIPSNLIASLQNLEKLFVRSCESLKEIFENIEEEEENVVIFSHLEEIQLEYLPKLDHIFNKIPKSVIAFQNLRKLQVYECNSLRNIFSVNVAKGLVQLQILEISRCEKLEEIVAKDEEEEASLDRIVFPQLKSLKFDDLPKLGSFYGGIYALELPSLETLELMFCNGMKTFSCGSLSTPNLVLEDLNATQRR